MKRIDKNKKRDIKDINFKDLLHLSKIDFRIHEILRLIDFIPEDIKKFEKEIEKIRMESDHLEQSVNVLDKKIEECDRFLNLEKIRSEKAEKLSKLSLDQKMFNASKRYLDISQKMLRQIEEAKHDHVEKKNENTDKLLILNSKVEDLEAKIVSGKTSLSVGKDKLNDELQILRDEEKALRVDLKSELMDLHDNLSNRSIRPTVVNVHKNRCALCEVVFPEQHLQEMLSHIPHQCPNCQRILISIEDETSPEEEKQA